MNNQQLWDELENGDLVWDELPAGDQDAVMEYAIQSNRIRIEEVAHRVSRKNETK